MGIKTRSSFYMRQLSDEVQEKLTVKASELNIAKWLLVEKVLEDYFGIKDEGLDLKAYLGVNNSRAKIGKPHTKKVTR